MIPSSNSVMEVDFYRSLPRDATLHVGRVHEDQSRVLPGFELCTSNFLRAADSLSAVLPHIVVFDCAAETVAPAGAYERSLGERIGDLTGSAAIGVRASVFQALRDVHAFRVAVVTPYRDDLNRRLERTIEAEGFSVTAIHGMGLSSHESASITSDALCTFVQTSMGTRVPGDALFVGGTNFPAMSSLSLLKISYDVPIVTSNLAVLQAVKRELEMLRQNELARLSS
jgi:maleate isomerase